MKTDENRDTLRYREAGGRGGPWGREALLARVGLMTGDAVSGGAPRKDSTVPEFQLALRVASLYILSGMEER